MSLIQEALRRRDADLGQPAPAAAPVPPTLPPPPPAPPPARRDYVLILLVVSLLALLGYGGWRMFLRPGPTASTGTTAALPVSPARPKATPPPTATTALPHTNLVAQAKAKLLTTLTPERLELVMGVTNAAAQPPAPPTALTKPLALAPNPPPAGVAKAPVVTPAPLLTAAVAAPVQSAAPAPKAPPPHALWPQLNITGIMSRGGGETVAFINGQLLRAGESIEGARVLVVTDSIVQVAFQGETNFFRVGRGRE